MTHSTRVPAILPVLALILVLVGCDPQVTLGGAVTDTRGEALPGVAVTLADGRAQAGTDVLGAYRLSCSPARLADALEDGKVMLNFIKTGYAPAVLETAISVPPADTFVGSVAMWPLPPSEGAYLLEDHEYHRMTAAGTKRYLSEDQRVVFGTKKTPELQVADGKPRIICYELPDYDLHLERLTQINAATTLAVENAADGEAPEFKESIWTAIEAFPAAAVPVDEPDHLLISVEIETELPPGLYAIHWGAFDGYFTTDSRAYLFEVAAPPKETVPEGAEGPQEGVPAE